MSKNSSFKDQQLIIEGWRTFMVEQQPVGQQATPQSQSDFDKKLTQVQSTRTTQTGQIRKLVKDNITTLINTSKEYGGEKFKNNKQDIIAGLNDLIKDISSGTFEKNIGNK